MIKFETANLNYSREILIEGSHNNKDFYIIKKGYISKLNLPNYKKINNSISFPEKKLPFYRVTVLDQNLAALKFENIIMKGFEYNIRFMIDNLNESPMLYFGNNNIKNAQFKIPPILKCIEQKNVEKATFINQKTYQIHNQTTFFNKKILLYILIIITVVGLIFAVRSIMKNIDKIPKN